MTVSRDTANNPERLYACPACDFLRDSPTSDCDGCGYDPSAIEADDDRDLGDHDPRSWIVRSLAAAIGSATIALILLLGITGVWGNPDTVDRAIRNLIALVLS